MDPYVRLFDELECVGEELSLLLRWMMLLLVIQSSKSCYSPALGCGSEALLILMLLLRLLLLILLLFTRLDES